MDFKNYNQENLLKMLLIGESGAGKTGALASLAKAGYKLRILDFDAGLDILPELLKDTPEALENIEYETCTDELHSAGGNIIPKGIPKALDKATKLLTNWSKANGASKDLGVPAKWGRDTFLVIDSLTHMGNAAMRRVKAMQGTTMKRISQPEWGAAQGDLEAILALLYSNAFQTNVIILSHIAYVGGESAGDNSPADPRPLAGYPMALGRALPPKIGSYFNTLLLCKQEGMGATARRKIYTIPDGLIGVKQPLVNSKIPAKLDISDGLAVFADLALGKKT